MSSGLEALIRRVAGEHFLLGFVSVHLGTLPVTIPPSFICADEVPPSTGFPGIWPAMRVGQSWRDVSPFPDAIVTIEALYPFADPEIRQRWGGIVAFRDAGELHVMTFSGFGVGALVG